jgi:hypothetical protein
MSRVSEVYITVSTHRASIRRRTLGGRSRMVDHLPVGMLHAAREGEDNSVCGLDVTGWWRWGREFSLQLPSRQCPECLKAITEAL